MRIKRLSALLAFCLLWGCASEFQGPGTAQKTSDKEPDNSPKHRCRRLFTAREHERAAHFVARDAIHTLAMETCNHTTLELLPGRKKTLRCRQCHLTIDANELGDGFCPECFDTSGKKFYEFEETESNDGGAAIYRCEECGVIIKTNSRAGSEG